LDPSTIVMIVSGSWAYGVGLNGVPEGPVTDWWPCALPLANNPPIEVAQPIDELSWAAAPTHSQTSLVIVRQRR